MMVAQALLLSVRCADLYTCMYIKGQKDLSLFSLIDLTEVGSPMISRVNNDVTLGLTTVRSLSHNREREFQPLCIYRYTDQRDVHSISTPVNGRVDNGGRYRATLCMEKVARIRVQ